MAEIPVEKVDVLTDVRNQHGTFHAGQEMEVPVNEVSSLVLAGAVNRKVSKATDDEEVAELRSKVVDAENLAMEAEADASKAVLESFTTNAKGQQDFARGRVENAYKARALAQKASDDLLKAEAALAEKRANPTKKVAPLGPAQPTGVHP
jgi:hypothetical protein